jgi:hypothetical protein
VFALAGRPASLVTVAGRELVRDGRLVAADDALAGRVAATAGALRDWRARDGAAPTGSGARGG